MSSVFKPQYCLICNVPVITQSDGQIISNTSSSVDIFDPNAKVRSGKQLDTVVAEILNQAVSKEAKSSLLCNKCHKKCLEYDGLQNRLESIKNDLTTQYARRLTTAKTVVTPKKIVLPASKLRPLPPQCVVIDKEHKTVKFNLPQANPQAFTKVYMVSDISPLLNENTSEVKAESLTTNLTKQGITIDSSLLLSPKRKETDVLKEIEDISTEVVKNEYEVPVITVSSNSILNFDINNLPKNFLENALVIKDASGDDGDEKDDDLNNDEHPMEIDEDCSYAIAQTTHRNDFNSTFVEHLKKESRESVFDIDILEELGEGAGGAAAGRGEGEGDGGEREEEDKGEGGTEFVLGKLEILHHDREIIGGEDTLVMSGDGEVVRMVSGEELLCGQREISLVIPRDDNDSQDSNDESQIELQVSGDEETANAIIAATKEQGGAFIKTQSGAMYRVKSIQSKIEDAHTTVLEQTIVSRSGSVYKCLLCANSENGKKDNDTTASPNKVNTQYTTSKSSEMTQHMKLTHNAKIYICSVCGDVIRKRTDYNRHMAEHDEKSDSASVKKHECNVCKKKFSSKNLLQEHMNTHSGAKPYSCNFCQKNFASKYTYQTHLKTHQDRPRPFECKQCKKTFFTQQNLNQHEKTHWGIKDFICNVCGKAFGTQHNLEVHGVVHSGVKSFLCGVCGKGFARKAEIRDHVRIHTGERPFSCSVCGAQFAQRSNLQSHARATHAGDKRHACQLCDKRFKRRRLLEYHIRASHTGERPYKCDICKATFVYPEHFKKHARIHSGEKPYVCEVCGKSFNTRDNRNAHRYVHSDKKPYECLVCGAGFMRKPLLMHHMNTSGHLTESIVVNQPRVTQDDQTIFKFQTMDGTPINIDDAKTEDTSDETVAKVYISADGEKKIFLQDGKSFNLVLEGDDNISLSDNSTETSVKVDSSILESIENGTQIVTSDENGSMVRLVQIQLPNGGTGWIAIN